MVFGDPRPSRCADALDGGALAFTQQGVGGAVDVDARNAAGVGGLSRRFRVDYGRRGVRGM